VVESGEGRGEASAGYLHPLRGAGQEREGDAVRIPDSGRDVPGPGTEKTAEQTNTAIPLVVIPRDGAPFARYLMADVRRTYPFYGADEDVENDKRFDAMDRAGYYWEVGGWFVPDSYTADVIKGNADYGNRGALWFVFRYKGTGKIAWRFSCEVPIEWLSADSEIRVRLFVAEGGVTMYSTLPLLAH